jgi:hypothetical protein
MWPQVMEDWEPLIYMLMMKHTPDYAVIFIYICISITINSEDPSELRTDTTLKCVSAGIRTSQRQQNKQEPSLVGISIPTLKPI